MFRVRRWGVALLSVALGFTLPWNSMSVEGKGHKGVSIPRLVKSMTLEEKVGQMTMVGFYGSEPTEEIRRLIQDHHAGNVILFAYSDNVIDPEQTARLNNGLQVMAEETRLGVPLLISTDQEGGVVARMTTGATELPGNMALAASRVRKGAFETAALTADELKAVGINMNLAPVVDVNVNPANPVIGVRSYGENPTLVSRFGTAAIRGYQKNGVVATAKHFPGHGDTDVDSHLGLPVIDKSREEMEQVEWRPFRQAMKAGVDAIMTAHIHVPALDDTPDLPATLSKPILTDLLRHEMRYKGLVITDAMDMAGVVEYFGGVEEAAVKAVEAGVDIVLLTPSISTEEQAGVMEAVVKAVRDGTISEKRIDQSVTRILKVKKKYKLFRERYVDVEQVPQRVGTPEHREKAERWARRSVTLVKNDEGLLPLHLEESDRLGIVSPFSLRELIKPYHSRVEEYRVPRLNPTDAEIDEARKIVRDSDILVVGTNSSHLYPQQQKLIQELEKLDKPIVVIAFRNPYDIRDFPDVEGYLTTYGTRVVSQQAAVETLFGIHSPTGKLPVTIPDLYPYGHGLTYGN
ncbi:glycoside hydrolase family 3 protein [Desmospora profundinema]|uniref:beta-N-acetylhexosaminidase n=1 Tax=Desmospora profundinema TaxID=1571184 RepID=A0ABU1IKN2_9BACL|nr:glycoside hydrolase family 3 protein [Desmospora profundinema]MDR6224694.1 beta-N-acetylhexosaminidase [Desmospora profundinema]